MYTIMRGGCGSRHSGSFLMSRPEGVPFFVLLNVRSEGQFNIGDSVYHINPGTIMIILPDTPYSYSNVNGDYVDDWLHFTVDDTAAFGKKFSAFNRPITTGASEIYTTLIKQIIWEFSYTPDIYANDNINSLMEVVINHVKVSLEDAKEGVVGTAYISRLRAIRLELQNSIMSAQDITECAGSMGISESYFQHMYRQLFGVSYQQDVIHFRIEYAKEVLLTTEVTMEEAAEICGYNNEVHFYRQFKKMVGITPAKFRKMHMERVYFP